MSESDIDTRLVAGLWQVVAERGWHGLTLRAVSEASGVGLGAIRHRCPGPLDLLKLHGEVTDRAVLAGAIPGAPPDSNTPRDRVFDVLMRRIDAMQPHRAGLLRFFEDLKRDPLLALAVITHLPRSIAWMLEAAGVPTSGLPGLARIQGTTAVWLAVVRAWAEDETADLGPTMAALDRALDRAEQVARSIRLEAEG